ncbi:MAG: Iron-regulated transporter permease protein SufD [Dehalococcoidia bacterium]|nr:Iron-regulated transporter permease protein SufD [Dehalococcoidia bacterium]
MPKPASTLTQEKRYLAAFASFERNGSAQDPAWAHRLRRAAIARFQSLGFPTARRGNEEWKYTDVGPIARAPFQTPVTPAGVEAGALERFALGKHGWSRLVFVDGAYAEELSSLSTLPPGVRVSNLAEVMAASPDLVEPHLARHADYESNAFTALNTAFLHDGALVHIPDGITVEEPIHLLFLSTSRQETASHPRVLILSGRGSRATIIESYGGPSRGRYFTNAVTEVVVGAGARVEHYNIQQQSEEAFHITTTQVTLGRDSAFSSVNIDLGGSVTRNNLNVLMGEEGCSCTLNGLYLVGGSQHVDNQVIVDHAKPYTTSRELYKGVLNGRSRSVFHGSIVVRKGARKVNANQVDKNLLLSDQAEADTKPAFWIYCDDVKCGHGAACGQIDETALFYLRSRGIGERAARSLLTRAFVSEVIDSIENEPVRAHVDTLVQAKLQEWLGE